MRPVAGKRSGSAAERRTGREIKENLRIAGETV